MKNTRRLILVALLAHLSASARPLLDLTHARREVGADHFAWDLTLSDALPATGKQPWTSLTLQGRRVDGLDHSTRLSTGPRSRDTPALTETASSLRLEPGRFTGSLELDLRPKEGPAERLTLRWEAGLVWRQLDPDRAEDDIRFWKNLPTAHAVEGDLSGRYSLHRGDELLREGTLQGTITEPWAGGAFSMGRQEPNGVHFVFNMGHTRKNWNHSKTAVYTFPAPVDLRDLRGLELEVLTSRPRRDAELSVWLCEADGSWYYLRHAVPLALATNRAELLFTDFEEAEWVAPGNHMDEDYQLDLSAISHLAVGVVNPMGVGDVSLTLTRLQGLPGPAADPVPVVLESTERLLEVNGHRMVPPGIFGGYAPDLPAAYRPGCQRNLNSMSPTVPKNGEAFIIDCAYDRYAAATYLHNPNWSNDWARAGTQFGEKAKALGIDGMFEFWNEPYLNWAERSRKNYDLKYFDLSSAVEGGPVAVKRPEGHQPDPDIVPHFQWVREKDAWKVIDSTAFSYWSGRGNGWLYDQMFGAFARAAKKAHPPVKMVAGWGFRWNEDHWAAWDLLYKPTLDRNIDVIDAVCEHHYQGDTTAMNGSYELLTAYTWTAHRKWVYSINTEANDLVDAPSRGVVDTPEKVARARDFRRGVYNLRDLLYCVAQSPDKFIGRTVIHHNQTPRGTEIAYGLTRNLRGHLVETRSSDPEVWIVASVDGTDPSAMPPEGGPQRLVVLVFNNHRDAREVTLNLAAPAGTRLLPGTARALHVDRDTLEATLRDLPVPRPNERVTVPGRSCLALEFPLQGEVDLQVVTRRRQHFSPDLLQKVLPDQPILTRITLSDERLGAADSARLRLVLEAVARDEGVVELNGTAIPLPPAITRDNGNRIVEIPVPLGLLRPENTLRFTCPSPAQSGYQVVLSSLVLEEQP